MAMFAKSRKYTVTQKGVHLVLRGLGHFLLNSFVRW